MPSKACSMLLIVVVVNVLNNDCARFSSRAMAGREEAPREEAPGHVRSWPVSSLGRASVPRLGVGIHPPVSVRGSSSR
jgi:hypothetical protein